MLSAHSGWPEELRLLYDNTGEMIEGFACVLCLHYIGQLRQDAVRNFLCVCGSFNDTQ